jgi:Flp pilus assembly pilin Flp
MFKKFSYRLRKAAAKRMSVAAMKRQSARYARRMGRGTQAQTMLEYALLAGFVAVVGAATLAAAPTTTENMKTVLNKLIALLAVAAGAATQVAC